MQYWQKQKTEQQPLYDMNSICDVWPTISMQNVTAIALFWQ